MINYNSKIVEEVRIKLLNGVLPYDLTHEEREEWSKFKDAEGSSIPSIDLTPEQEDALYKWLITDTPEENLPDEV